MTKTVICIESINVQKQCSEKNKRKQFMNMNLRILKKSQQTRKLTQKYFWHLVNKGKKGCKGVCPIMSENKRLLCDPNEICEEWKNYFKDLYKPQDKGYDNEFKEFVEKETESMITASSDNNDSILLHSINSIEIESVIKGLKNNKAPGFDNIPAECYKHAGKYFIRLLTMLFNMLITSEYVPLQFKRGVIIPIPKGEKDKSLKDNYRGITLLPVLSKIFEKCIIVRVEKWCKLNNIINVQQGAAQSKCSSMHVAWLVKECISKHLDAGQTVYTCLLDTKKAYDSVWQNGLFYALFSYGINGKSWRVLREFYCNFKCYVRVGNVLYSDLTALQGIHQGAPCSMLMFEIFTSNLLDQL